MLPNLLGPKLLFPMGCMKLGEKIAFTCLLWVNKPQINYPISRNPWEVIISGPVDTPCLALSPFVRVSRNLSVLLGPKLLLVMGWVKLGN